MIGPAGSRKPKKMLANPSTAAIEDAVGSAASVGNLITEGLDLEVSHADIKKLLQALTRFHHNFDDFIKTRPHVRKVTVNIDLETFMIKLSSEARRDLLRLMGNRRFSTREDLELPIVERVFSHAQIEQIERAQILADVVEHQIHDEDSDGDIDEQTAAAQKTF